MIKKFSENFVLQSLKIPKMTFFSSTSKRFSRQKYTQIKSVCVAFSPRGVPDSPNSKYPADIRTKIHAPIFAILKVLNI